MYAEQVNVAGELLEAVQALRMLADSISRSIGQAMPDVAGRLRVITDGGSTLGTITTLSTLSTLSNQTLIGGYAASEQIPMLMHMGADNLRRNIQVS